MIIVSEGKSLNMSFVLFHSFNDMTKYEVLLVSFNLGESLNAYSLYMFNNF